MDIPGFVHLLRDWVVAPESTDQVRDTARRAARQTQHYRCAACPGPSRRPADCAADCAFTTGGPACDSKLAGGYGVG